MHSCARLRHCACASARPARAPAPVDRRRTHIRSTSHLHRYKLLAKAFREFDIDKSGSLSPFELEQAVKHFNFPFAHEHVMQIALDCADQDGDGEISYAEFAAILKAEDNAQASPFLQGKSDKELQKEFKAIDLAAKSKELMAKRAAAKQAAANPHYTSTHRESTSFSTSPTPEAKQDASPALPVAKQPVPPPVPPPSGPMSARVNFSTREPAPTRTPRQPAPPTEAKAEDDDAKPKRGRRKSKKLKGTTSAPVVVEEVIPIWA